MAAVDRRTAILSAHGTRLSGRIAWFVWLVAHITFMTGFKNRFTALIHWLLCFVGTGRCERAIVVDLDRLPLVTGDAVGVVEETMRWLNDAIKLGNPPRIRFIKNRCAGLPDFASWHLISV